MSHIKEANLTPEFSGLRAVFWPIHSFELKKFMPMGLMMFCILFNYTIVRDLKDALVVKQIGGAAISFVKFWATMPAAIIFVVLYTKLSSILSKKQLFYVSLLPFLLFFACFGFVLYPNLDIITPAQSSIDNLVATYPRFEFFFRMYGKWPLTLFYAFAELWGSVVISLLFWQFANDITRIKEAKRFYSLFGMIANLGLVASGLTLIYFSNRVQLYTNSLIGWSHNLQYIMSIFVLFGVAVLLIYNWMHKNVLTDPLLYDPEDKSPKKKKTKLGLIDSVKLIFTSKYIGLIAALVLCYGIAINLIEVTWKNQLGHYLHSEHEYTAFMGKFSLITGLVVIPFMFIGSNIVRKLGWRFAAAATPVMIALTGFLFFSSILFSQTDWMKWILGVISMTPIVLAVYMGMAQNILSKATKYSLFDATKEMSYIPLSDDLKVKGKAAVDVIGGRMGKSGGSVIQQTLIMTLAVGVADPQSAITPYLLGFVGVIIVVWLVAVGGLSKLFGQAAKEKEDELAAMESRERREDLATTNA